MLYKWNQIGIDSGSVAFESESILFLSTTIRIGIYSTGLYLHWNQNWNQFRKFPVESESILMTGSKHKSAYLT